MLNDYFYSLGGERLMKRPEGALFIAVEGSDGAGKTTQANLLKEYFESNGRDVLLTKEPTIGTEMGDKIKRILYGEEEMPSPKDLQRLYIEDRRVHIKNEITPSLDRGMVVICDRYAIATFAHAMLSTDDITDLVDLSNGFIMPDITIMILTDPKICMERLIEKNRELDFFEDLKKIEKIDENYRELAKEMKNVYIVNSGPSIEEVHDNVIKIMESVIK